MSEINKKLDEIDGLISSIILSRDCKNHIRKIVDEIRAILISNGEKNMEDILKEVRKLNAIKTAEMIIGTAKEISDSFKPKDEQKFIITYYYFSEFRGYYNTSIYTQPCFTKDISKADNLNIDQCKSIIDKLKKEYHHKCVFGLLPAPEKKGWVIKCKNTKGVLNGDVLYLNLSPKSPERFVYDKSLAHIYSESTEPNEIIKYAPLFFPHYVFEVEEV